MEFLGYLVYLMAKGSGDRRQKKQPTNSMYFNSISYEYVLNLVVQLPQGNVYTRTFNGIHFLTQFKFFVYL